MAGTRSAKTRKLPQRSAAPGRAQPARPSLKASGRASRLDQVIHERMRLGIVTALAASGTLSFTELRGILETSDGNLSVHARRLEEAGYIECSKRFEGRTPRTEYRLSSRGREALNRYLSHLQSLIEAARGRGE